LQIFVIIAVVVTYIADGAMDWSAWRFDGPAAVRVLVSLGLMCIPLLTAGYVFRACRKGIDSRGSWRSVIMAERASFVVTWWILITHIVNTILMGWVSGIRDLIGNWVLIDELIAVSLPIAAVLLIWALHYPINRRIREAGLMRRLDEGKPVYAVWTRRQYVVMQFRTQFGLLLPPILLILAWSETVDRYWPFENITFMSPEIARHGIVMLGAFTVFLFAPLLVRLMWDTTPLANGALRDRLNRMCAVQRIRVRELLVWNTYGMMINGAVMGLLAPVRYVLLTDALLDSMDEEHVEAVMAHELGHVRRHHMFWLAICMISIFTVTGSVITWGFQTWYVTSVRHQHQHQQQVQLPGEGQQHKQQRGADFITSENPAPFDELARGIADEHAETVARPTGYASDVRFVHAGFSVIPPKEDEAARTAAGAGAEIEITEEQAAGSENDGNDEEHVLSEEERQRQIELYRARMRDFERWLLERQVGKETADQMLNGPDAQPGPPNWIEPVIIACTMVVGLIAFGWCSRRFERQADTFAVQHLSAVSRDASVVNVVSPNGRLNKLKFLFSIGKPADVVAGSDQRTGSGLSENIKPAAASAPTSFDSLPLVSPSQGQQQKQQQMQQQQQTAPAETSRYTGQQPPQPPSSSSLSSGISVSFGIVSDADIVEFTGGDQQSPTSTAGDGDSRRSAAESASASPADSAATVSGRSASATDHVITRHAVDAMVGALEDVAVLNHMSTKARSWRHGSIDWRQKYLRSLVGKRSDRLVVDRTVFRIRLFAVIAIGLTIWWGMQSPDPVSSSDHGGGASANEVEDEDVIREI
jgi:Zn-dependent protease with chaperone function